MRLGTRGHAWLVRHLLLVMVCTCGRPAETLISLLDQIPETAPAGPWRVVVYETDGRSLAGHAVGFRQEENGSGNRLISSGEIPSFRFHCAIPPEEPLMIHIMARVDGTCASGADKPTGRFRVHVLNGATSLACVEDELRDVGSTVLLDARNDVGDALVFEFSLPSGVSLAVSAIAALALKQEATDRDIARAKALLRLSGPLTSRFFEGASRESSGSIDLLRTRRFPVALDGGTPDGSTKECIALVGTDTLTLDLPPGRSNHYLRFWEKRLEAPSNDCGLSVEVRTEKGWARFCRVDRDDVVHVRWRRFDEESTIKSTVRQIRFLSHGGNSLSFLADPLLLPATKDKSDKLNLVLIVLDTLRSDRLGCYGYTVRPTSTRLDSLAAARGFFLFERAYSSSPWTVPSMAKLFASRYRDIDAMKEIPRSYTLLAEKMRNAGYYCVGFTGGLFLRFRGFEQGFHEYSWTRVAGKVEYSFPQATQWLRDDRTNPFFLFLHTYETHEPLTRDFFCRDLPCGRLGNLLRCEPLFPSTWQGWKCAHLSREESTYVQAAYDSAVRTVCDATVDFLTQFDGLHLWEDTVVLITSDHGEEFWDHFQGFSRHGHSLYGELLNIPLLLYVPEFSTTRLQSISTEVSLVDVVPTLEELLGLEPRGPSDGISLCPLLCGERVNRISPILATHRIVRLEQTLRVCSIEDGVKHIEPLVAQNVPPSPQPYRACFHWSLERELYDLDRDPHEQNNEAWVESDMADSLAARTRTALTQSLTPIEPTFDAASVPVPPLPSNLREQLKAVGYVEE